ncbi:MAG: winged helix-turn-helix transcriptional regulator [Bacteroidetes bacterium]|nr:winged helix-turn-helix transcriptional regulator [Bacteroidota bacterium]
MPKSLSPLFLFVAFACLKAYPKSNLRTEQQIQDALRVVGHRVLLQFGDSISRVLPIHKIDDNYQVYFETDFGFNPDSLITIINDVLQETEASHHYRLAVKTCNGSDVVYSYELNLRLTNNLLPCAQRDQPVACYELWFTFLDLPTGLNQETVIKPATEKSKMHYWLLLLPIVLVGVFLYLRMKKKQPRDNVEIEVIQIGKFEFNPKSNLLEFDGNKIELSGKESELLLHLYNHKNETLERDEILAFVWKDEGAYVGRTLDVFISKLRKKLSPDVTLKILNIRGVGYRLIVEG